MVRNKTMDATVTAYAIRRALEVGLDNEQYVRDAIEAADGSEPDADTHISAVTLEKALDGDLDYINYVREAIEGLAGGDDVGVYPD